MLMSDDPPMFVPAMDDGGDEDKNKGLGSQEVERGMMEVARSKCLL